MAENDLSKIVNLIMQNPELIEQIKKLGDKESTAEEKAGEEATESASKETSVKEEVATNADARSNERKRRHELLCALKPYVSEGRGRAIDSMMSITDILDVMRSK